MIAAHLCVGLSHVYSTQICSFLPRSHVKSGLTADNLALISKYRTDTSAHGAELSGQFGPVSTAPKLRPAANRSVTRFALSQHVEIARTWSQTGLKPNSITLTWLQTGSKLVADRSEAGRRPASSCYIWLPLRPASDPSATGIA